MFKIHDDKVYFVAETPNINKVIEIFLPKDDRESATLRSEKQGTPKIFHGDSIALATTNKPLAGQKKAGLVVLSTCLNIQNLLC